MMFALVVMAFILSYSFPFFMAVAQTIFVVAIALFFVDLLLLFNPNTTIECERKLPKVFSLGDSNQVDINLENRSGMKFSVDIIDEIPVQFQKRDFQQHVTLNPKEEKILSYKLRPVRRGEYEFGAVNIFISSILGLAQKRIRLTEPVIVPVFPSIIQMKNLSLQAFDRTTDNKGIKKLRRIGHSYEFEQIKNYVKGDDFRSVNWKASSRRGQLMVNQYEDEKAQQVYNIIDKSRTMKMPFNDMSLIDYAINTSLVISNVSLQKHDRAGLITFSDKIGTTIQADRSPTHINKILNALYKERERKVEANFELLYHASRKLIKGRSLVLLYTNFESLNALDRVLPILRRINTLHLLVVVFFKNTEVEEFVKTPANTIEQIYHQTIAQQFIAEKDQMIQKLKQYGIQAVLTRPEDLSINTLNKYLELKARGLI